MVSRTYHLARPPSCWRGWTEADVECRSPSSSPPVPRAGLPELLAAHTGPSGLELGVRGVSGPVGTEGSLGEAFLAKRISICFISRSSERLWSGGIRFPASCLRSSARKNNTARSLSSPGGKDWEIWQDQAFQLHPFYCRPCIVNGLFRAPRPSRLLL